MKIKPVPPTTALSRVEVAVIAGLLLVLGMMVFSGFWHRRPARAASIRCMNHLKVVGLAFRNFATENPSGRFPFGLANGTGSFTNQSEIIQHFLLLRDGVGSPKILHCPKDVERQQVDRWTNLSHLNLSYFVGLLPDESQPEALLGGDRNMTRDDREVGPGLVRFEGREELGFTSKLHNGVGNVLLGDGSVQQFTKRRLDSFGTNTPAMQSILVP